MTAEERAEITIVLAQLRHAYQQLIRGEVRLDHMTQKVFAAGLLSPQIKRLEELINE